MRGKRHCGQRQALARLLRQALACPYALGIDPSGEGAIELGLHGCPMSAERRLYVQTVIGFYLEQPQAPATARRADWAIATSFHQQGTPLAHVLHARQAASRSAEC